MSSRLLNAAVAFLAITAGPVLAGDHDVGPRPHLRAVPSAAATQGQYAAPPAIAARSALPACGFARPSTNVELLGDIGRLHAVFEELQNTAAAKSVPPRA